jgi:hypothetical protein
MANQVGVLEQETVTRLESVLPDDDFKSFLAWELDHAQYIEQCQAEQQQWEEQRRREAEAAYFAWENDHKAWLARCEAARLAVQKRYEKSPGHLREPHPAGMPWLAAGLSDEERETTRQAHYTELLTKLDEVVSWPARMAARSLKKAVFVDEFMWYNVGDPASADPEKAHLWKSMSPESNQLDDHFDYAYTEKKLSAFSLTGQLLHIRATEDTQAVTPQDKYVVFTGNMETQEASRLYVQSVTTSPSKTRAHHFDETWVLSHEKESFVRDRIEDENDPLEAAYWRAYDERQQLLLPRLTRFAEGYSSFTIGNGAAPERLHDIGILARQRRHLGSVALASGKYDTNEHGVLTPKQPRRLHVA